MPQNSSGLQELRAYLQTIASPETIQEILRVVRDNQLDPARVQQVISQEGGVALARFLIQNGTSTLNVFTVLDQSLANNLPAPDVLTALQQPSGFLLAQFLSSKQISIPVIYDILQQTLGGESAQGVLTFIQDPANFDQVVELWRANVDKGALLAWILGTGPKPPPPGPPAPPPPPPPGGPPVPIPGSTPPPQGQLGGPPIPPQQMQPFGALMERLTDFQYPVGLVEGGFIPPIPPEFDPTSTPYSGPPWYGYNPYYEPRPDLITLGKHLLSLGIAPDIVENVVRGAFTGGYAPQEMSSFLNTMEMIAPEANQALTNYVVGSSPWSPGGGINPRLFPVPQPLTQFFHETPTLYSMSTGLPNPMLVPMLAAMTQGSGFNAPPFTGQVGQVPGFLDPLSYGPEWGGYTPLPPFEPFQPEPPPPENPVNQ